MHDDRRQYSRIPFDAETLLQQDGWSSSVQLLDISLRGVLVMQPQNWSSAQQQLPFSVIIELAAGSQICMEVTLVHAKESLLGFQCQHIDLDSISHLRRLLALNLGDASLLDRELATLL